MAEKFAFFGPMASGKSTYLARARLEIPNGTVIETDSLTNTKDGAVLVASTVALCKLQDHAFITAGMADATVLGSLGYRVVRIIYSNKLRYLQHARQHRPTINQTDIETWYDNIRAIPNTVFSAEINPDIDSVDQGWARVAALL